MASISTRRIVLCALFSALTTVATMVIQIPSPMSGYVNLGDVFVLFGAFVLGPLLGAVAAGLGSALADVLTGYVIYAPATLIIKAGMALIVLFVYKALKKLIKTDMASVVIASIVSELFMVLGYFLFACLIMGKGLSAAASIPGNLVQGVFGVVLSSVLYGIFIKSNLFNRP